MTIEEAFEEICCDVLGDMNIFAGTGRVDDARYSQLLTSAKKSAERQANQGRAPPKNKGVKYSIEHDVSNTPYVVIDTDILDGVPKSEWVSTVKKALAKRFPNGVHVGNNVVKINKQTRREMTYSQYSQWLANNDEQTYADKFRAANNANEIILASRAYINEGLKHARKDNIRDFARGTVLLRVGNNDYSAEVVIGTTSKGDMLLYDIVNLKNTQIQRKKQAHRTAYQNSKQQKWCTYF